MVMERLRYEVKEHVLTLLLSAKGKVLGIEEVFVGSASQATVHPGKSSRPPFIIMRLP